MKVYGAEGGNYVIHLATGDPEIGTDIVVGVAASDSTETSTVNGTVDVYMPLEGIVWRGKATTPSNLAEGIIFDTVTFDYTSLSYTVDENEGTDENVHGLRILDYDTDNGTVDFIIKSEATILDCMVT